MGFNNITRQTVAINSKAMIHGNDFYFSCCKIFNRMIGAMMTLRHFMRLSAHSKRHHLMAKTNAKNRGFRR